jgi:histidyl-tRNA synthetase
MANRPQNVKGMLDHLPPSQLLRQHIITTLTTVFERHGFEPMSTPAVEYAATLEGKIGDEEKLIFRVEHSGGGDQQMALRYDQTVPLARVVAQYQHEITLPFRRYAVGPSYRGERPQKGRYREFTQADIDIVGSDSPLADAEVIAVVGEGLRALGFSGFRTLINHRDVLAGIARVAGLDEAAAGSVYRAVDKLDKIGRDGVRGELLRYGVAEEAADTILDTVLIEGAPETVLAQLTAQLGDDERAAAAIGNLRQVLGHLQAMGVPEASYAVAPSLARGLSYYTGVVFETVIEQPKIGALLGGGRYDELIGQFAGRRIPTVGMAMGVERLAFVMGELGLSAPRRTISEVIVTVAKESNALEELKIAKELRKANINTEIALNTENAPGIQRKKAAERGVLLAIGLPEDNTSNQSQVELRRLDTSTNVRQIIDRTELISKVQKELKQIQEGLT